MSIFDRILGFLPGTSFPNFFSNYFHAIHNSSINTHIFRDFYDSQVRFSKKLFYPRFFLNDTFSDEYLVNHGKQRLQNA